MKIAKTAKVIVLSERSIVRTAQLDDGLKFIALDSNPLSLEPMTGIGTRDVAVARRLERLFKEMGDQLEKKSHLIVVS